MIRPLHIAVAIFAAYHLVERQPLTAAALAGLPVLGEYNGVDPNFLNRLAVRKYVREKYNVEFDRPNLSEDDEEKPSKPSQIHIALSGDASGIVISWVTGRATDSIVKIGKSADSLDQHASGNSSQYSIRDYTSGFIHHVEVPRNFLEPSETFYYQCGDIEKGHISEVFAFHMPPPVSSTSVVTLGVIGDLGQTEESLATIKSLLDTPKINALLIPGDLSYADGDQTRWDTWGDLIQPLAATTPMMVGPGNHELDHGEHFVAFQNRFKMPFTSSKGKNGNLYYSFNIGSVHVVFLNSYEKDQAIQHQWLLEDLKGLDRKSTPWVVVLMHNPWYNSNFAHQSSKEPQWEMRGLFESTFFEHNVDIVITGHVHAYERTHPVYDHIVTPAAPYYFTMGSGGNREGLAYLFIEPPPAWSAFRTARYGAGRLNVVNATHCLVQFVTNGLDGGVDIVDSKWIVRNHSEQQSSPLSDIVNIL